EASESRLDVSEVGALRSARDAGAHAERRVHNDEVRENVRLQPIVQLFGVEPGDGRFPEQLIEEGGASVFELVEVDAGARDFGEDREQSGAGRGLEHYIAWPRICRDRGAVGEVERRGELLEADLAFRASRLRRGESRNRLQAGQRDFCRNVSGDERCGVTAQIEDL